MTWNEIASAVCICISSVIYSFSLQGQTKLKILFVQLFSSTFYLLNFVFVFASAKAAAITAVFEIIRIFVFYFIERDERFNTRKNNLIAMITFSIILTACSIFTWDGWISIIPLFGTVFVSIALGCKNLVFIKFSFAVQAILISTYLFMLSLWINAASQVFVAILGIVGLVRLLIKIKKEKNGKTESNSETDTNINIKADA